MNRSAYSLRARVGLAVCSIASALLLLEGLCRLFGDQLWSDKAFVAVNAAESAACYPTDGPDGFPVNLNDDRAASVFAQHFPDPANLNRLRAHTPYCIIYDLSPTGPRRLINDGGLRNRLAILGDSFAFGEGVTDENTYGYRLAHLLQARVRIYAWSGADIEQIEIQFHRAIADADDFQPTQIIYLFVLNDPLKTDELKREEAQIADFMGALTSRAFLAGSGFFNRAIHGLGRRSMLWQRLMRRVILTRGTRDTIKWYQDIFDEHSNPRLVETFDRIQRMDRQARARKIPFYLVVYPLMVNLHDYPFAQIHQTIRRLATARGVPVVDLLPAFEKRAGEPVTVHPIDSHPNALAHRIAAAATVEAIWGTDVTADVERSQPRDR